VLLRPQTRALFECKCVEETHVVLHMRGKQQVNACSCKLVRVLHCQVGTRVEISLPAPVFRKTGKTARLFAIQ